MIRKNNSWFWKFRLWFYYKRLKLRRRLLLKKVIAYSKSPEGISFCKEGEYLKYNGLKVFPYEFEKNYKEDNIKVSFFENYPFINYCGKSLYFPNDYSVEKCKKYCNDLLMEQDKDSPHIYSSPLFSIEKTDIIVDIGCAEGNFSLEYIDKVKEAFLFELDSKWKTPLELTFAPWKDKVHFSFSRLRKPEDLECIIGTNSLMSKNLVFKIDVDGAEREILSLLEPILPLLGSIKVAICTYHQASDASDFEKWFLNHGFKTEFSSNFMLFYYDKLIKKPFFRRGVLFALKE